MPSDENASVTVIVPCRNEIRHIHKFLDSVIRQETGKIDLEILVADGVSDDGTREVLSEYERKCPAIHVIDNQRKIASAGLNAAIRAARGEFIVRMDAHTEYAPDYIRACLQVFRETGADNVGGPALTRAEGFWAEAIARAYHCRFASGGARFHDAWYEGEVDTVTYGFWKKSTLLRLGLFDEQLFRNQDGDLNLRIREAGGRIWQSPRIVSWYRPRPTLSALFRQYFQYGFWKASVIRKHRRPVSWRNLVPGASLSAGLGLLVGALLAGLAGSVRWESAFLALLASLAVLYIAASFGAAILAARHGGWRFLPALPFVFATYHLAHALGFLLALAYQPVAWDRPSYLQKVLTTITR